MRPDADRATLIGLYFAEEVCMIHLNFSKWILAVTILVPMTFLVAACTDKPSSATKSDYSLATELMEQGQFNSAIFIMQGKLDKQPHDQTARLLLASAYAGRANVHLNQFFDVARELDRFELDQSTEKVSSMTVVLDRLILRSQEKSLKEALEFIKELNKVLTRVDHFLSLFDMIPKVSSDSARNDLLLAIDILSKEPNLSGGALIYRALLRLTYLKSEIESNDHLSFLGIDESCRIDPQDLRSRLSEIRLHLEWVVQDFTRGRHKPIQAEVKWQVLKSQLDQMFESVSSTSQLLSAGDLNVGMKSVLQGMGNVCH